MVTQRRLGRETVQECVQRAFLSYRFGACSAEQVCIEARALNHRSWNQRFIHATTLFGLETHDVGNVPVVRREQALIARRMEDDAAQRRRRRMKPEGV